MRRALAISVLLLFVPALVWATAQRVNVAPGDSVEVASADCDLTTTAQSHRLHVTTCGAAFTPTPLPPTRTPQATSTATRTPTATGAPLTATATSTATPTSAPLPTATSIPPTPVPPAPVDMHEGVPVCATHDRTRWHALVERDGSGAITCTYAHEHHDNPNTVNDIFGPPSAWYGGQQEISYPWQTVSDLGAENALKHEGYKYMVKHDMPCVVPAFAEGCITAWRVQVHALGGANDAVVRFHSFSAEVQLDRPGDTGPKGIARYTGHLDGGHLALNVNGGSGTFVCPHVPSNPASFSCGRDIQRQHSSAGAPAPFTDHKVAQGSWYAVPVAIFFDEWGPIDYADPSNQLFHGGNANNSRSRVSNLIVDAKRLWSRSAADRLNLVGYRDRAGGWGGGGVVSTTCTQPTIACWPFSFENARWGVFNLQTPSGSVLEATTEHDIPSPVTGRSLIRFPN